MNRVFLVVFSFFLLGPSNLVAAEEVDKTSFNEVYKKYNELIEAGDFRDALEYAELSYELGKEQFDEQTEERGILAYNLGFVANRASFNAGVHEPLEEALAIFEKIYGPKDIRLLDVLTELSRAFIQRYEVPKAEKYFKRANEIAENNLSLNPDLFIDLNLEMGQFLYLHSYGASRKYFQAAYDHGNAHFIEGKYKTGVAAFSLGKFFAGRGMEKKAEQYLLEALKIYEENPPENIDFVLMTHAFLVQTYLEQDEQEKADKHCVQVGTMLGDVDIKEMRPLYIKAPLYPARYVKDGKEGSVLLEFTVDAKGKILSPSVVETTSPLFSKAALNVVSNWRYAPRVVDGKPVDTEGVRYQFLFEMPD